jgi:hypothetical protein
VRCSWLQRRCRRRAIGPQAYAQAEGRAKVSLRYFAR